MRKVKYNVKLIDNFFVYTYNGLTEGKVYNVVKHIPSIYGEFWDELIINNDNGEEIQCDLYDQCDYSNRRRFFTDATPEYRNIVIDGILK